MGVTSCLSGETQKNRIEMRRCQYKQNGKSDVKLSALDGQETPDRLTRRFLKFYNFSDERGLSEISMGDFSPFGKQ